MRCVLSFAAVLGMLAGPAPAQQMSAEIEALLSQAYDFQRIMGSYLSAQRSFDALGNWGYGVAEGRYADLQQKRAYWAGYLLQLLGKGACDEDSFRILVRWGRTTGYYYPDTTYGVKFMLNETEYQLIEDACPGTDSYAPGFLPRPGKP